MFGRKKYLPAEEAITRGNSDEMEIKYDIAAEGDLRRMKIRMGYNQNEKMYFVQITEKETLLSHRIYLTESELKNLIFHMSRTIGFTQAAAAVSKGNQGNDQSIPPAV